MAKVKLLDPSDPRRRLDRYELIGEIATGGMATVFLARRGGAGGFQRFVAIKRLHPHLANEPEFVEMFLDEARLAALIHHPNVVPILEVGETEAGYYLVMEYVEGDTLSKIVARSMSLGSLPPRHIILRMVLDALAGLHAAHELRDERGQLLGLVHRDVSPQNVLVGVDGSARITDFGVARASSRLTSTAHGKLKGKLAYMAPEQTRGDELDRRTDLFAMGIILWEVLCGRRLFKADSEAATLQRILVEPVRKPSEMIPDLPTVFDTVVLKALDRDPNKRFQTGADFADALEAAARSSARESVIDIGVASPRDVASFLQTVLGQEIGAQRESVRAWLAQSDSGQPVVVMPTHPPEASPASMRQVHAAMPQTVRQGSVQPPPGSGPPLESLGSAAGVPQFDVAADVTMRFSLEQEKTELPRPSSPPPRNVAHDPPPPPSSRRMPPPRLAPLPPPSQPTLLGQGPPVREDRDVPPPPRSSTGGPSSDALDRAAEAIHNYTSAPPPADLGEDAVTIARPGSAPPAPVEPAVRTQRGLFAEPLLAEAKKQADVKMSNGAASAAASFGPMRTPRMPMPADLHALSDPERVKIQSDPRHGSNNGAPAGNGMAGAGGPMGAGGPIGAGIAEVVPLAAADGQRRPASQQPRTLVSASGEVSAGGFTPGSMTLPTDGVQDATVVHTVRKGSSGKYIVVAAAFLLVFGVGLLFLRSQDRDADRDSASPARTSEPTSKPTAKAEPTAEPSGAANSAPSSEPSADPSGQAVVELTAETAEPERPTRPIRGGGRGKPAPTSAETAKPTVPTGKPPEDLGNPYR